MEPGFPFAMMTASSTKRVSLNAEGKRFLDGVEQFNRGDFFDAHETWEALWLGTSGSEKVFLQALIQLAAAFHHWQRGNCRGALSLLRRGTEKLSTFPSSYGGIRIDPLRNQGKRWAEELASGQTPQLPLPKIEYDSAKPTPSGN